MRKLPTQPAGATAALLTPAGRGAVATIQICGPLNDVATAVNRFFRAVNDHSIEAQPVNRICFGYWGVNSTDGDQSPEEVVVCRTTEESIEVNCHGGRVAAERILDGVASAGIVTVSWQRQRELTHGPFDAEMIETLTRATTLRTAAMLHRQHSGLLKNVVADIQNGIRSGSEEIRRTHEPVSKLNELLAWGTFGLHLTAPWRVLIIGRTNAGKSTLLNALLGFNRAIVYDEPGTTRDLVTGETAFDGWPVLLTDTAGFRETADELEAEGMQLARQQIERSDCICLVCDTSRPATDVDVALQQTVASAGRPVLTVAHKSDLPYRWGVSLPDEAMPISSIHGEGISKLIRAVAATLVPVVPDPMAAVPVTQRQVDCLMEARDALQRGDSDSSLEALDRLLNPDSLFA